MDLSCVLSRLPSPSFFHQVFNTFLTTAQFTWPVHCSLNISGPFPFVPLSSFPSAWKVISSPSPPIRKDLHGSPRGEASPFESYTFSSYLSDPPFISLGLIVGLYSHFPSAVLLSLQGFTQHCILRIT